MTLETSLLYLLTWTLVAITPGPAVLCCMAQSTRYSFAASLVGVAGIQLGNLLFFVAIALGLGAVLAGATTAFAALRLLGAAYLVYLGVRIIVASFRRGAQTIAEPKATGTVQSRSLFLQGLLIQLTNPKALLFVSALLPQFIDPSRSLSLQLIQLGLITIVVDVLVLGSYAFVARKGAESIRGSRVARWFERAFGAALIFFGIRLFSAQK